MRRLEIEQRWFCDCRVHGRSWVAVPPRDQDHLPIQTSAGDVALPEYDVTPHETAPENVQYVRLAWWGGFAGNGHHSGKALEYTPAARQWVAWGPSFGPNAVIYDRDESMRIQDGPPPYGYRYVDAQNQIIRCSDTYADISRRLYEFTEFPDVAIGQGESGVHVLFADEPGVHRLLEDGDTVFVRVDRQGDDFAIAFHNQTRVSAIFYWLTLAELRALPEVAAEPPAPPVTVPTFARSPITLQPMWDPSYDVLYQFCDPEKEGQINGVIVSASKMTEIALANAALYQVPVDVYCDHSGEWRPLHERIYQEAISRGLKARRCVSAYPWSPGGVLEAEAVTNSRLLSLIWVNGGETFVPVIRMDSGNGAWPHDVLAARAKNTWAAMRTAHTREALAFGMGRPGDWPELYDALAKAATGAPPHPTPVSPVPDPVHPPTPVEEFLMNLDLMLFDGKTIPHPNHPGDPKLCAFQYHDGSFACVTPDGKLETRPALGAWETFERQTTASVVLARREGGKVFPVAVVEAK